MNMLATAEAADHAAAQEMDRYVIVKSALYTSGERDPRKPPEAEPARQIAPDGSRSAAATDAGAPDPVRLLQTSLRFCDAHAAECTPRPEERRE